MFLFRLLFSLFSTTICVSSKCNLGLVARVNEIKYALRILLVIAAVAKVSCKHELWLVARVNKSGGWGATAFFWTILDKIA